MQPRRQTMDKLKKNKILEDFIDRLPLHLQTSGDTPDSFFEKLMEGYRWYADEDFAVTFKETENIISALKSMPGFSMERFMTILPTIGMGKELSVYGVFTKTLWIAYYMLSITNPELFEEASDENHEV